MKRLTVPSNSPKSSDGASSHWSKRWYCGCCRLGISKKNSTMPIKGESHSQPPKLSVPMPRPLHMWHRFKGLATLELSTQAFDVHVVFRHELLNPSEPRQLFSRHNDKLRWPGVGGLPKHRLQTCYLHALSVFVRIENSSFPNQLDVYCKVSYIFNLIVPSSCSALRIWTRTRDS